MTTKEKQQFTIYTIILLFNVLFFITKNVNLIFLSNIFLSLIIVLKCKFSFFSLKTILINYILSPCFFQYNFSHSYGILESYGTTINFFEMNFIILIYNLIWYFLLSNSKLLEYEKKLINNKPKISKTTAYIFCIIAIISTTIRFQDILFPGNYDRFTSLLPGNGWNHVAMLSSIFAFSFLKKDFIVNITYLFVGFEFLSHYERVDIIGLLFFCIIFILNNIPTILKKKKNIILIIIIFIVTFGGLSYIEDKRSNSSTNNLIEKVLIQKTATDVAYTYNVAIEDVKKNELYYGKTYISYLEGAIPLRSSKYDVEYLLNEKYHTAGGNYLLNEPIINFGFIGIVIFAFAEYLLLTFILNNKYKDYCYYVYGIITLSTFRIVWYGLSYVETTILFILPAFYILSIISNKLLKEKTNA